MKKVLITGASDGIGRVLALKLAGEYELILFGRDRTRLQKVADECGGAEIYDFDLNDATARASAVSNIKELDILINNAGIWHKVGDLETIADNLIEEVINTNLLSQILLTKALLPKMRSKEGSAIINVISKSGITNQQGQSVYTASKYGMRGFTDVLREDTKEEPIKIGAVYQSGTDTQMFAKAGEDFPTDTFTQPDSLADVIKFMLSRPKDLWINEVRIER